MKIGKARFFAGITLVCACATLSIYSGNAIDWEEQKITVLTRKTHKDVTVPIHPGFASWLQEQTRGIGKAPVFPRLAGKSGAGKSGLSMQFKRIMDAPKSKDEIAGETSLRFVSAFAD